MERLLKTLLNIVIEPLQRADMTVPLRGRIDSLARDIEGITSRGQGVASKPKFRRFFSNEDDASTIADLNREIDRVLQAFLVGGHIEVELKVEAIHEIVHRQHEAVLTQTQKALLDSLPVAVSARYDHISHALIKGCLEGTRVSLLMVIDEWAEATGNEGIFWLKGIAGTGKSTIARTVAARFKGKHMLGGSFLFSRDEEQRRNGSLLIPTIAFQLASYDSLFKEYLAQSLEASPEAKDGLPNDQVLKLIVEPLQKFTEPRTFIIVIDALDECDNQDLVSTIMLHIASSISRFRNVTLKFFITSRPDIKILRHFEDPVFKSVSQTSALHEVDQFLVQKDIDQFFRNGLKDVPAKFHVPPPWPSEKEIERLVALSGALFIMASTVLRFITSAEPKRRMKVILELQSTSTRTNINPLVPLDRLYLQVLTDQLRGEQDEEWICERFRRVVGAVVLVLDPLTPESLECLLGLDSEDDVGSVSRVLDHLHSIIIVPSNRQSFIRLFHPSFPNFLVDSTRCPNPHFYIDPKLHHTHLAIRSLYHMNTLLRRDILRLPNPLVLNNKVPALYQMLDKAVPPHLRYACQHWATHVENALHDDKHLLSAIHVFVTKKLLQWLEILSLYGLLNRVGPSLQSVIQYLGQSSSSDIETMQVLNDCQRMVQRFFPAIYASASHIYHSALAFIPDCRLYGLFKHELDRSVSLIKGREAGWSASLSAMKAHSCWVTSVSFSSDGTRIVSGSDDKTVQVWDAATGENLQKLQGHSDTVTFVSFSPDGTRIASGSEDGTVQVWDVVTGANLQKLQGHSHAVISVSFSLDGTRIVSGSYDKTVQVWDVVTGANLQKLQGHSDTVTSVSFSPDKTRIVSGSSDRSVQIWDTVTGANLHRLQGHSRAVTSVSFSPDGTRIVSGSSDRSIQVWDAMTGANLQKLQGYSNWMTSVSFSTDGQFIISVSLPYQTLIWHSQTYELQSQIPTSPNQNSPQNPLFLSGTAICYISGNLSHKLLCLPNTMPNIYTCSMHGYLVVLGLSNGELIILDFTNMLRQIAPV